MIDFRYHLVSLVSVFLALAIGIVLGAGPLKEGIDISITDQVRRLTTDKAQLRDQLDATTNQVKVRDEFTDVVAPSLVSRQLGGQSVVLVLLPGADADTADALASTLQEAGATVTGRVSVQDAWVDPTQRTFRSTLAGQLISSVQAKPPPDATPDAQLAAVLGRALVTKDLTGAGPADPNGQTILGALAQGDLIAVQRPISRRAALAVVLDGAVPAKATADELTSRAAAWATLTEQLHGAASGTVVAGSGEQSGTAVAGVRDDSDVAAVVSSVDDVGAPMGLVSTVLALREQATGRAGQYGAGKGARSLVPPLTSISS